MNICKTRFKRQIDSEWEEGISINNKVIIDKDGKTVADSETCIIYDCKDDICEFNLNLKLEGEDSGERVEELETIINNTRAFVQGYKTVLESDFNENITIKNVLNFTRQLEQKLKCK